jgi:hypothetical protein
MILMTILSMDLWVNTWYSSDVEATYNNSNFELLIVVANDNNHDNNNNNNKNSTTTTMTMTVDTLTPLMKEK